MTLETIFQKFDQFADAPNAVTKMRELVLQLAVTGKLVPQKYQEAPASALLEDAHAERALLIADRKIKARPSTKVEDDERPFEVPPSWEWVRLADVGHELGQKVPDKRFTYIDVGSIDADRGRISERVEKLEASEAPSRARKLIARGTVIYSTVRPYLLNIAIIDRDYDPEPIASTAFGILHPFAGINSRYLFYWLRSAPFTAYVQEGMKGMAYPAINDEKFYSGFIALPPLAEQKRIVAKVNELMALCDRLEAQQQERETQHTALTRASLARFAAAPTPANLPLLFHPAIPISPADLRKSILDLAVYGKLATPTQDDEEIPSIEEFRKAAATLAYSLGLRSPKESLDEAEPPFNVPAHWRWIALADLGAAQTGTTPSKNDHEAFNGDIPFIKPADILPDAINYSNESLTRYGAENGSRLAPAGSLLMVCIGTIGKCNLIERQCAFNQQINSLSPVQWIESRYLLLAARAPYFQDAAWKKSSSTTIAILNKGRWLSIPVPIPPLAEQRRIVAIVDQLMNLVDQLETLLAASRTTAANLLEAIVAELAA